MDLANPDYVVSVDVLNRIACVSVMKDFNRLRKYNLQELAKSDNIQTSQQPTVQQSEPAKNEAGSSEKVCSKQGVTSASGVSGGDLSSEKLSETGADEVQVTSAETDSNAAACSVNILSSS